MVIELDWGASSSGPILRACPLTLTRDYNNCSSNYWNYEVCSGSNSNSHWKVLGFKSSSGLELDLFLQSPELNLSPLVVFVFTCWLCLLPVGGKIWLCLHHKFTSIINKLLFFFNPSGVYCIMLLYLSVVPLLILFFNMWKKSNQCENNAESILK